MSMSETYDQMVTSVPETTGEQLSTYPQTPEIITTGSMEDTTSKINDEYEAEYCDNCGRECDGAHAVHTLQQNIPEEKYDINRIYYKKCGNYIVTLALYPSSKLNDHRTNIIDPTHAKLRTDKVFVLDIEEIGTGKKMESVTNTFFQDKIIEYKIGTKIETEYNNDLNNVCTEGIHIFKSRETAELYTNYCYHPEGYTGAYYTYHENGALASKCNIIHGKLWFEYYAYDEYGVLNYKGYYLNNKKNGKFYEYFENNLSREYTIINDLFEGSFITYDYKTQQVLSRYNYVNDVLDGPYFDNTTGQNIEGYYMNGVRYVTDNNTHQEQNKQQKNQEQNKQQENQEQNKQQENQEQNKQQENQENQKQNKQQENQEDQSDMINKLSCMIN